MRKSAQAEDSGPDNLIRWCVVASRVNAVIYRHHRDEPLQFLERLSNPSGRLLESELSAERPGTTSASARGSEIRHSVGGEQVQHERVASQFARRIARVLEKAAQENRFGRLVLIAEPHFLGQLKHELSASVRHRIEHELAKEFHQGSDRDLLEFIQKNLFPLKAA